jgi:hypothetical protein
MNCPGSEQAAAYSDGRLDADDAARYLEHCSECDDCRRTLALLVQPRSTSPVPSAVEARAVAALRRSLDRDRTPKPFRRVAMAPPQSTPAGLLIAAALLVGFVGVVLATRSTTSRIPEPREIVQRAPILEAPAPRELPLPPIKDLPKPETPVKVDPIEAPRPVASKPEEPREEPTPEIVVRETTKVEALKPEEPAKTVAHVAAARTLTEIQVTDIAGPLSVHRKGAKSKERLAGVARLGEGDVLSTEKPASFQVEGRHPVVLSENASISMAYSAQEQAPWISVQSGEATVESTGASRWVVTDGVVAVAVKPAKARFTASRRESRLAIAAHAEPLYVQPDGGRLQAIPAGQELHVAHGGAELRSVDASVASKRAATFDATRPRQRTVFYTSCDPADAKREHFFVQEGGWLKNDGLLSRERPDRTASAAIGPNPRFAWRDTLTLRFRYMTNCKSVETQMRVDEKKYTLVRALPVDRRNLNQWMSVEIPFALSGWPVFRKDDGGTQLVVSTEDKFDSIRFVVRSRTCSATRGPTC